MYYHLFSREAQVQCDPTGPDLLTPPHTHLVDLAGLANVEWTHTYARTL